jgi:hypothetical protein
VTEGTAVQFTVTATPAPTANLQVSVELSETGDMLTGTEPRTETVTIPTTGSATLTAATDDDTTDESNSTVTATVNNGTGYTVGNPSSASVTVNDNDGQVTNDGALPAVTISAVSSSVTEGTAVQFTVTATPAPTANLQVSVGLSETGDMLTGTEPRTETVTINAGATTATLTADTVGDTADEPNSTVTATVNSGTGYTVGSPDSAGVTVNDDDASQLSGTPVVRLVSALPNPVEEDGTLTVTARLDRSPTMRGTVEVTVRDSVHLEQGPDRLVFEIGATTASARVFICNDGVEQSRTLTVGLYAEDNLVVDSTTLSVSVADAGSVSDIDFPC